ncbi:MAG: hypothetical protein DRJ32_04520 [Thermoprotei archaeon]|nr:MAG: hypothetical protein DRJ32_04520 [Thermoprotei archaeon]HDD63890.1 hypothetical protein [Thermoprotei archaeon]
MKVMNRIRTGTKGLDELIEGGFPENSLILLAGHPGTGKTIMSWQFLIEGARNGEKGLYISFMESPEEHVRNLKEVSIDIQPFIDRGLIEILELMPTLDKGLESTLNLIWQKIEEFRPKRIVLDSVTAILMVVPRPESRVIVHLFKKVIRKFGSTAILIVEVPVGKESIGYSVEEFVADGIIFLRHYHTGHERLIKLDIIKMRGTNHSNLSHAIHISNEGLEITGIAI